MDPQSMIEAARKQQQLTGNQNATVSFVIRGKWSASCRKRLHGRRGPYGHCVAEYDGAVLCLFDAAEVIKYCSRFLPRPAAVPLKEGT